MDFSGTQRDDEIDQEWEAFLTSQIEDGLQPDTPPLAET